LEARYNIVLPEDPSYETVGGFVLNRLGFIPRGGESFETDGYRFTVMEMDHRRVSRLKIKPLRAANAPAAPSTVAEGEEPAATAQHQDNSHQPEVAPEETTASESKKSEGHAPARRAARSSSSAGSSSK
ncbi:MAG: transporter associated domain-containing protein, partial [Candidatus Acidiferrales bacterium]